MQLSNMSAPKQSRRTVDDFISRLTQADRDYAFGKIGHEGEESAMLIQALIGGLREIQNSRKLTDGIPNAWMGNGEPMEIPSASPSTTRLAITSNDALPSTLSPMWRFTPWPSIDLLWSCSGKAVVPLVF